MAPHDAQGNVVEGDALLDSTSDCYVYSERALVSTLGVKNLVIVDTPDALLVADRSRAQDVSSIVANLKRAKRKEHERHLRSYRPWGYFETLSLAPRFQVKLLHVKPGGKLSMQMHHHRSGHWVVVHGTARVSIGGEEKLVRENESVYIVATQWHGSGGQDPLELIEVRSAAIWGGRHRPRRRRLQPRPRRDEVGGLAGRRTTHRRTLHRNSDLVANINQNGNQSARLLAHRCALT
jgi:mannose-1-phosphate guanylyltransferase/mannose-6-phosphate isomerase